MKILIVVLTFLTISGGVAGATTLEPVRDYVPPDPCGSVDQPCYAADTLYTSCKATGSKGQQCQTVVIEIVSNIKSCASVDRSAYCNCDWRTLKLSGTCTYVK